MSKQYSGGLITKNPVAPTSSAAPGVWTLEQQMQAQKAETWPTAFPNYIEDVFSTWLTSGTGASQTVVNGIDLSTKGGLIWEKLRGPGTQSNSLTDTVRGLNAQLNTDSTGTGTTSSSCITAFNTNGFNFGTAYSNSGDTNVFWTFRKQKKFFTQGTFTGNGANRTISHDLGSAPGMIIVKRTDTTAPWIVYHRSLGATKYIFLNATSAASTGSTYWNNTDPTSTVFSLGTEPDVNGSGGTFVYYAFAHDAGGFGLTNTDNVISCGSTTNGSTVNLGYEPQWVLMKNTAVSQDWFVWDTMRGMALTYSEFLYPNLSSAAVAGATAYVIPTATGFTLQNLSPSNTYIYIAIRRGPMKVPTDGTTVFKPVTQSAGGTVTTNFPVDMTIVRERAGVNDNYLIDRLRGDSTTSYNYLLTNTTAAASSGTGAGLGLDSNTGFKDSLFGGTGFIYWNFKRAPSFFDEVCYTGDSLYAPQAHNLKAVPELIISKPRSTTGVWYVWIPNSSIGYGVLNTTAAFTSSVAAASSTTFDVVYGGTGVTYVNYLFATCPGVSKVGSYTGNGSSQTINCGFAAGARFVLIKRTDSTGDWYVWDTARGIVASTDPHLSLNTTAAEVTTDDTIDTDNSGFVVNQLAATNVNVTSATYIYLAIA